MNFMISFPSNKFQYLYYLVSAQYYICCCCCCFWDLLQSVLYLFLLYIYFLFFIYWNSFILFVLVCSIKWYSSRKAKLYIMRITSSYSRYIEFGYINNENSATNNTSFLGKIKINIYINSMFTNKHNKNNIFISSCILFVRVFYFIFWYCYLCYQYDISFNKVLQSFLLHF